MKSKMKLYLSVCIHVLACMREKLRHLFSGTTFTIAFINSRTCRNFISMEQGLYISQNFPFVVDQASTLTAPLRSKEIAGTTLSSLVSDWIKFIRKVRTCIKGIGSMPALYNSCNITNANY
jgi:hypothetical protein